MEVLIFLPGIMGSKLKTATGEEVWPPTPLEALTGYKRTDKLISPTLTSSGVIEKVCVDVYGSLTAALAGAGYTQNGPGKRLILHHYDWRRDLRQLADDLDQTLTSLVAAHGPGVEIKLVCHSMGGLVARGCLEKQRAAPPAWIDAVKLCVFLATPHEGAPLAFARAIGKGDGSLGMSPDQLRKLSGANGFPAGYQLFPPPILAPIWDLDAPTPLAPLSLFDPAVTGAYPLNANNQAAAAQFYAGIDPRRRPVACRYFSVVSASHETLIRFDRKNGVISPTSIKTTGDGTVPIRSAAALDVQTAFVDANHVGVAQHKLTHALLRMLLGVDPPGIIAVGLADNAVASVSLSVRLVAEAEPYEILIVLNASQPAGFEGRLAISKDDGAGAFAAVTEIAVSAPVPGLDRLSLRGPVLEPGSYRFDLVHQGETIGTEELLVFHQNVDP